MIVVETATLILRTFSIEDAAKVCTMSREEGMKEWIPNQVCKDKVEAREVLGYLIDKYSNLRDPRLAAFVLGICLKSTLELIGHVGLSPFNGEVEIGYANEKKYQNRGFKRSAHARLSELSRRIISLRAGFSNGRDLRWWPKSLGNFTADEVW